MSDNSNSFSEISSKSSHQLRRHDLPPVDSGESPGNRVDSNTDQVEEKALPDQHDKVVDYLAQSRFKTDVSIRSTITLPGSDGNDEERNRGNSTSKNKQKPAKAAQASSQAIALPPPGRKATQGVLVIAMEGNRAVRFRAKDSSAMMLDNSLIERVVLIIVPRRNSVSREPNYMFENHIRVVTSQGKETKRVLLSTRDTNILLRYIPEESRAVLRGILTKGVLSLTDYPPSETESLTDVGEERARTSETENPNNLSEDYTLVNINSPEDPSRTREVTESPPESSQAAQLTNPSPTTNLGAVNSDYSRLDDGEATPRTDSCWPKGMSWKFYLIQVTMVLTSVGIGFVGRGLFH